MNENTGNTGNDFFYDLLDNPADLSHSNTFNLQSLISEFPQSGLLRAMLAVKREEGSLHSASAYVNPKLLYVIANAIGALRPVSDEQIVICQKPGEAKPVLPLPTGLELPNLVIDESNYFHIPIDPDLVYLEDEKTEDVELLEENPDNEDTDKEIEGDEVTSVVNDQDAEIDAEVAEEKETEEDTVPSSEIDAEVAEEKETEEDTVPSSEVDAEVAEEKETEQDIVPSSEVDAEVAEEKETEEDTVPSSEADTEIAEEKETEEDTVPSSEADTEIVEEKEIEEDTPLSSESDVEVVEENETDGKAVPSSEMDTEVAEETEADIKPAQSYDEIDDEVFEEIVSIEDIGLEQLAIMDKAAVTDEAEHNITTDLEEPEETAAGDSYFVFEPALPEDEEYHEPANIATQDVPDSEGHQRVSRYNDEKMPYSFMWWLDKTRKEHAAIYQPFAAEGKFHTETVAPAEKQQPAADHLQQQYVENIFAVSSVVSDLKVIPPKENAPSIETKADKIIEKFIHEEPQIKHPSKVKLDSENKAKKSSEDRDELVTETLAKIYTEQMLYHKAILTYKKLMLKFPEKSLYFAGQIEQLENKIN